MIICDELDEKVPEWIPGHLYTWDSDATIYMATSEMRLVDIANGRLFEKECSGLSKNTKDVTNQYCLKMR